MDLKVVVSEEETDDDFKHKVINFWENGYGAICRFVRTSNLDVYPVLGFNGFKIGGHLGIRKALDINLIWKNVILVAFSDNFFDGFFIDFVSKPWF